jgi:hypothetical protein
MNASEALRVLAFVQAACPSMKMDEHTPDAWVLLLASTDFADAQEAVVKLGREQAYIAPSDIVRVVRIARRERATRTDVVEQPPDADPDDVPAYLAALRENRHRAANGLTARPMSAVTSTFRSVR